MRKDNIALSNINNVQKQLGNNTGKNTIAENLQPKTRTDNYSSKLVCEMSYSSSQKKISTDEKLEKLKL